MQIERSFRLLAEAIPQIVWAIKPDGDCDYQNGHWFTYSGLTSEQSRGSGWMSAVHPDDRTWLEPAWSAALNDGEPFEFEYRLRRADGVFRWFLVRASRSVTTMVRLTAGSVLSLTSMTAIAPGMRRCAGSEEQLEHAADVSWPGDRGRDAGTDPIAGSEGRQKIPGNARTAFGDAFERFEASEDRFRTAADVVKGVIYDWDLRTGRVDRSSGLHALTGFRPKEVEPSTDWWRRRVHPDDLARAGSRGRRWCGGPGGPPGSGVPRTTSGRNLPNRVWDRARTILDDQGRPARVIGWTIDITEHRRAQAALLENERRFRKLADSNIIGVIFGDVLGGISYANDEYLRILGYSRDEFESREVGWGTVTPSEWRVVDDQAIAQATAGDGACTPYEKEYIRKDGTRISVLVGFTLFSEVETVAFILDLSERKRSETALRESQERLSLAMEGSRLGMWDWDVASERVLWNVHHETIFGYEPGTPLRPYRDFADRVHPHDLPVVEDGFREAMANRTEYRFVHRVVWPSGDCSLGGRPRALLLRRRRTSYPVTRHSHRHHRPEAGGRRPAGYRPPQG